MDKVKETLNEVHKVLGHTRFLNNLVKDIMDASSDENITDEEFRIIARLKCATWVQRLKGEGKNEN